MQQPTLFEWDDGPPGDLVVQRVNHETARMPCEQWHYLDGSWGIEFLRTNVDPAAQIIYEIPKHKYAFGLTRKVKRQLAKLAQPYPKG